VSRSPFAFLSAARCSAASRSSFRSVTHANRAALRLASSSALATFSARNLLYSAPERPLAWGRKWRKGQGGRRQRLVAGEAEPCRRRVAGRHSSGLCVLVDLLAGQQFDRLFL
jgi:hypothetical protein